MSEMIKIDLHVWNVVEDGKLVGLVRRRNTSGAVIYELSIDGRTTYCLSMSGVRDRLASRQKVA